MGGQGNFADPRLGIDVKHAPDMVTAKLPALRAYQYSLTAPPPPAGSFDAATAARGRTVSVARAQAVAAFGILVSRPTSSETWWSI